MRLSWAENFFTVSLEDSGVVVTADRCRVVKAGGVLDAHLAQLVRTVTAHNMTPAMDQQPRGLAGTGVSTALQDMPAGEAHGQVHR